MRPCRRNSERGSERGTRVRRRNVAAQQGVCARPLPPFCLPSGARPSAKDSHRLMSGSAAHARNERVQLAVAFSSNPRSSSTFARSPFDSGNFVASGGLSKQESRIVPFSQFARFVCLTEFCKPKASQESSLGIAALAIRRRGRAQLLYIFRPRNPRGGAGSSAPRPFHTRSPESHSNIRSQEHKQANENRLF